MLQLMRFWFGLLSAISPAVAGRHAARLYLKTRPHPVTAEGASDVMASAEHSTLPWKGDAIALYRWPRPDASRVLVVHGWSDCCANLAPLIVALRDAGFDVYGVDMPGHGKNPHRLTTMVEWTRGLRTVAATSGTWHAVIGHSLGAACAALATQKDLPLAEPAMIAKRLALLAPPDRVRDATLMFAKLMGLSPQVTDVLDEELCKRAGADYRNMSTAEALAHYEGGALVIHDVDDRRVPITDFHAEQQAAPRHDYVETRGLGHRRILSDASVIKRVVAFVSSAPEG